MSGKALATSVVSNLADLDPTGIAKKIVGLALKVHEQYEQMEGNKEACRALNIEVKTVSRIVQDLSQSKNIEYCVDSLQELEHVLEACVKVISASVCPKDAFDKMREFLFAGQNKNLIEKLTKQLRELSALLNLALTAQTQKDIKGFIQQETTQVSDIQSQKRDVQGSVEIFVKEAEAIREGNANVKASAGRDVTTITGGVSGGGAIHIGGGNSSEGSDMPPEDNFQEQVDALKVLGAIKSFFRDGDYEGERSKELDLYNQVLKDYNSEIGYNRSQKKHTLYINDEPIESQNVAKEITRMIDRLKTLKVSSEQSAIRRPNGDSDSNSNRGHANVEAKAGRDVSTITGGVSGGGPIRIGGGDTYRAYAPSYSAAQNNYASKYSIGGNNNEGNMQVGDGNVQNNSVSRKAPR